MTSVTQASVGFLKAQMRELVKHSLKLRSHEQRRARKLATHERIKLLQAWRNDLPGYMRRDRDRIFKLALQKMKTNCAKRMLESVYFRNVETLAKPTAKKETLSFSIS